MIKIKIIISFLILANFNSCNKSSNVIEYQSNIIFDSSISKDDFYGKGIPELMNYISSSECGDKFFYPNVKVIRRDISKDNFQNIELPLSSISKFLRSIKMKLKVATVKKDYDDNISKLAYPELLSKKSENTQPPNEIPNAILYNPETTGIDSLKNLIALILCKNNSSIINIIVTLKQPTESESVESNQQNNSEIKDNYLQKTFESILNETISYDERKQLAQDFLRSQTSDITSIKVFDSETGIPFSNGNNSDNVGSYVNYLLNSSSVESINIKNVEKNTEGIYIKIEVIEKSKSLN